MAKVWSEADVVLGEVEIEAPVERVFRAITDPGELAKWWGAADMYRCESWKLELRPGTPWRCDGRYADGNPFHVAGEVVEVDPPRLLVYTWKPSWEDLPATLVRWELREAGGKTRLCLRHSGFAEAKFMEEYGGGWSRVLGWLEDHLKATTRRIV